MQQEPDFLHNLNQEFRDGRRWLDRTIVLAYAAAAGLCVVAFTLMADAGFEFFESITTGWAPGAAGSGIPQVIATLDPALDPAQRGRFVSLWLSFAKMGLASAGFAAGLSIGREGPSVQVAAGVMHHARRWFGPHSGISHHALLVAGGAAGIAAAFNAPLAGLMGVSAFGNLSYFGRIQVPRLTWDALLPGLCVTLACGVLGGLFAKLLAASLTRAPERLNQLRARFPIRFAAAIALVIAVIGMVTGGATFGAGSEAVKHMLAGQADVPSFYVTLKFIATWLSAWVGVPGGIFAPSLSIGAGVGHNVAELMGGDIGPALIAMGMAAFLAAVTQAPLTAFIIVMEMVDGHSMVLSLMAAAMLASLVSRMLARPLYETLAQHMLSLVPAPAAPPPPDTQPSTAAQDADPVTAPSPVAEEEPAKDRPAGR
jgi:H+/Cl- antiporter ClcA